MFSPRISFLTSFGVAVALCSGPVSVAVSFAVPGFVPVAASAAPAVSAASASSAVSVSASSAPAFSSAAAQTPAAISLREQAQALKPQTFTPFGDGAAFRKAQALGMADDVAGAQAYYAALAEAIMAARFAADTTGGRLRMLEVISQPAWALAIGPQGEVVLRGYRVEGVDPRAFFGDRVPSVVVADIPRKIFEALKPYSENQPRATADRIGNKTVDAATLDEYIEYVGAVMGAAAKQKTREQHQSDLDARSRRERERSLSAYRALGQALALPGWDAASRETLRQALLTQNYDIELRPKRVPGFNVNAVRLNHHNYAKQQPDVLARLLAPQSAAVAPAASASAQSASKPAAEGARRKKGRE